MNANENRLQQLLRLKVDVAQNEVSQAQARVTELQEQLVQIAARRNSPPENPQDQIFHERHLGWLDRRAREISVDTARAKVALEQAKSALAQEFGRKAAFEKALQRRDLSERQRKARQLS